MEICTEERNIKEKSVKNSLHNHPIVALASPYGTSALAIIRCSGSNSISLLAKLCDKKDMLTSLEGGRTLHCSISNGDELIDEVVVAIYRSPHSFTGEDCAEIFCHGSMAGVQRILSVLYAQGFAPAEAGEFTERAFLHGKLDLTQAEAIHEIITAKTEYAHALAQRRRAGAVSKKMTWVKEQLLQLAARVVVSLDYPEEEILDDVSVDSARVTDILQELLKLSESYATGKLFHEGVSIVLAGRPNAGKSSLFNALLREERAIVSEHRGTTRDYIESGFVVKQIPCRLYDTAGLREGSDAIEREGISRSRSVIENADYIIYVVDGVSGMQEDDKREIASFREAEKPLLCVWNKCDVATAPQALQKKEALVSVSAMQQLHMDVLVTKLHEKILATANTSLQYKNDLVIYSLRQKHHIDECVELLQHVRDGIKNKIPLDAVSMDIDATIREIAHLTGEISSADIRETVFRTFCIGK